LLASLSTDEPRVAFAPSLGYLLLGSFQTLYCIKLPECYNVFEVALPEGGSVHDLRVLTDAGRQVALVVSDACLRLVEMSGRARWSTDFLDPVEIAEIRDDIIICRSLIPDGNGDYWCVKVQLENGRIDGPERPKKSEAVEKRGT